MRFFALLFACLIGTSSHASSVSLSATGGFAGPIGTYFDPFTNEVGGGLQFFFSNEDPVIASIDPVFFGATSGSMDLFEIATPSYKDVAVHNCTGLMSILCDVRAISYNTTLSDWDFKLNECVVDCNLEFDLFGFTIETDDYLLAVAFDNATVARLTPIPLPASAGFLLVGMATLWGLRRRGSAGLELPAKT